jgi:hypothetical protein
MKPIKKKLTLEQLGALAVADPHFKPIHELAAKYPPAKITLTVSKVKSITDGLAKTGFNPKGVVAALKRKAK